MIQKILILIVLMGIFTSCKAQTTNKTINTMEAYTKKINKLEIKMFIDTDTTKKKTSWNIYVYNSKKDSVLIDHFERDGIYEKEQEYISGDIRKRIIIGDAILENKTIYLMLYNHAKTYLNTYSFFEDKKFIKNEYFGGSIISGSYLNYGHPFYLAELKVVKDNLFINMSGGTEVFPGNGSGRLLKFNTITNQLTRITFNETSVKKVKDNKKLFETLNLNQQKETVSNEIKKVLTENKIIKENDSYKYLDFLYDFSAKIDLEQVNKVKGGTTYFFYKVKSSIGGVKIVRYNNYENEWLLDNFKEERIKM